MWKGKEKIQNVKYLENEKSFLGFKLFFIVFEGSFVEFNSAGT